MRLSGPRPPAVILPLPSIEQMQIRVVLARTPVVLTRPVAPRIRRSFRRLLMIVRRVSSILAPRSLLIPANARPRGPPVA